MRKSTQFGKVVAGSMIGTAIEWYDFFIYGATAALVFNKLFFPEASPTSGTFLALATYAVGFVARPIGAVVFGHFGDRKGRMGTLVWSLTLMGATTFLIGCLPTHAQIGMAAPLLLVILRFIQGFALGGEWGGAVLLVAEHGSAKRRGFWTAFPMAGGPAGNIVAVAVLALMSGLLPEEQFLAWGWRIPFLLSAVLVLVGLWVRTTVSESPVFQEAQAKAAAKAAEHRMPLVETLRKHPRQLLAATLTRFAENASYYIFTVFLLTYVAQGLDWSKDAAMHAVIIATAVEMVTVPLWGLAADRFGRRPVYLLGALTVGIWSFAFFPLIDTRSEPVLILAVILGLQGHAAMSGAMPAMFSELFSTEVRYSGMSIAFQFASIFAGSLAPIIALALFNAYGTGTPVALYLSGMVALSVFGAWLAGETRGADLARAGEQVPEVPAELHSASAAKTL
ncbi:MFS transporter [Spirillospora sp. CA-255316]